MNSLTSLILTALLLSALLYGVYVAVRAGVRDGIRAARQEQGEKAEPELGSHD